MNLFQSIPFQEKYLQEQLLWTSDTGQEGRLPKTHV